MEKSFILKGDICFSKTISEIYTRKNSYLVCINGFSAGVFQEIPEVYRKLPVLDYSDKLIVPGLVDLHVHAPQYSFCGMGMDLELLDWLNRYTFPEESRYQDIEYAKTEYKYFTEDLKKGPNTRACIFATIHNQATEILMDLLEATGLCTMVGKVNMDRNSPDFLRETSANESIKNTLQWLADIKDKYQYTKPILTPRFIPSCTDQLMKELGKIQQKYNLPVQSHLSENLNEIAWVKDLCPNTATYGHAYDQFRLFGGKNCPTVMAHCVYSNQEEIQLMKQNHVFIAHCPASNTNLSSGIAPVRRYLNNNLRIGLGSDVAGGTKTSIFQAMADAIQVSKLYWRLVDNCMEPLTAAEAFYLGTLGGGAFFGKVGSLEKDYEFDALIIDDRRYNHKENLSIEQRLERTIYLSDERDLEHKYVQGRMIF